MNQIDEYKSIILALISSLIFHLIFLSQLLPNHSIDRSGPKSLTVKLAKIPFNKKVELNSTTTKTKDIAQKENKVTKTPKYNALEIKPIVPNVDRSATELDATPSSKGDALISGSLTVENKINELINFDSQVADTQKSILPYQNIEAEYEIHNIQTTSPTDLNKSLIGSIKIMFNSEMVGKTNTYSLTSTAQTNSGLPLTQAKSEGVLAENGLRPNYYTFNVGGESSSAVRVDFAWGDGAITVYDINGKRTKPLVENAQDELSYLFQFMFSGPSLEAQFKNKSEINNALNDPNENLENKSRFEDKTEVNEYSVIGEETITIKLGEFKTIHISKSNGSKEEKTELWLAIDYHYLPIKIQKSNANGEVIEQTATSILTESHRLH